MKDVNLETIIEDAVVVQDLATQWIQQYPCKTKISRETERACKSSWSRRGNPKSFFLTVPLNLANIVKIYVGIIGNEWDC